MIVREEVEHVVMKKKLDGYVMMSTLFIPILVFTCFLMCLLFSFMYTMSKPINTASELTVLKEACIEYKQLNKDGKLPDSLTQLTIEPSITSDKSVDNRDHGALVDKNNFNHSAFFRTKLPIHDGNIADYWGEPIQYTVDNNGNATLTSTGSGDEITVSIEVNP